MAQSTTRTRTDRREASPQLAALADRYRVERELGRGGAATVYLATDLKHGRPVAVKVLSPDIAASMGSERFLREIAIVAQLVHPNIAPLIDSGEAAGWLYHVSPYIAGGSLRDLLDREGRLPAPVAVRIAQELGEALDYAHRSGFVHRDVKPANVLLADGRAVLADFGIARSSAHAAESITGAGLAVGTPEYMSPEQASGEHELTGASDTYSLACVVYEMLAGEPPIRGANARETIARQVTGTPRPLRALRPDAPPAVEAALARALAKDPAERFATVAEFVEALRATDASASGASVVTHGVAVLPFVNASPDAENEYLSDGITDELIDALAKVPGLRVAARSSVYSLKGRSQDVRAIGALLGVSVVLEGTVRRAGTRLRITAQLSSAEDGRLLWSQRYDRALGDMLALQDEIAATIVDALRSTSFAELATPARRRYTASPKAYALYLRGRHAWNRRSREGVAEAISYFEQAIAEDPGYALAYTGLADAYALHVDYRNVPVTEGFRRARAHALRALALDDSLAEAHASLAWTRFIHDWDWEGSEESFRRAIALDPEYATAHQWHAFLLAALGRTAEGLVEAHTAQELDPASVSIRRTLGVNYFYARRWDRAAYHLGRAVAMDPSAEETHRMLGLTLAFDGRLDEAERSLREGLAMPGATALSEATLGYVLGRAGRPEEAAVRSALLRQRAATDYVSPVAFAMLALGEGALDEALDWAERAYTERRGWLAYLAVNPVLDPLREHPRFKALMRRMRLHPVE